MSAYQNLIEARARISDPKNWTKGHFRFVVKSGATSAVSYCAIGAVLGDLLIGSRNWRERKQDEIKYLYAALPYWYKYPNWMASRHMAGQIEGYNDGAFRTHEEILALYDKAIELAAKDEHIYEQIEDEIATELPVDHTSMILVES